MFKGFELVALLALAAPATAAPGQTSVVPKALTAEQWRADLRFMAAEMKARHANLYHRITPQAFDAAVADLDRRIPALERNQVIVGMMRIAAMVGDGHTRIDPRKDKAFAFPSMPVKFYDFDDGIYVRAAGPGSGKLLGAKVEAVGGVPIADAWRRIAPLVSGDNMMAARMMVPLYLAMPDVLQAVGLSERRDSAVLTLVKDGKRWTETVTAEGVDPTWPPDTDISLVTPEGWLDAHHGAPPMWLADPLNLHRLESRRDRGLLYAQFNQGTEFKDESVAAYGQRIAARVKAEDPRALVFDLRLNYGGNGDLRDELVRQLIRAEDEDTRLFVLTARGSFSATQFYLDDLARLSHAVIVGEPASGRPTSYGDAYKSIMPNSGIAVRTSIVYWKDGQDKRDWTPVDLAVPYRFADYVAGRDPVLEAALDYRPAPALLDRLNVAAKAGGPKAAVAALKEWQADPVHRYADLAGDMVQAIAAMDDNLSALSGARWIAAAYPRHRDAQTVHALFAEAIAKDGAEAVAAARRALALDANNRQAQGVLDRQGKDAR